eukprot:764913-Hanusia_phi.AAC.3
MEREVTAGIEGYRERLLLKSDDGGLQVRGEEQERSRRSEGAGGAKVTLLAIVPAMGGREEPQTHTTLFVGAALSHSIPGCPGFESPADRTFHSFKVRLASESGRGPGESRAGGLGPGPGPSARTPAARHGARHRLTHTHTPGAGHPALAVIPGRPGAAGGTAGAVPGPCRRRLRLSVSDHSTAAWADPGSLTGPPPAGPRARRPATRRREENKNNQGCVSSTLHRDRSTLTSSPC